MPYTGAQSAGDLNVVVVSWGDSTATVGSLTDSSGNTYHLAVGPTVISGTASQAIYYAASIVGAAAGANTVSVSFTSAAVYPDVRVLEYSGIATTSPLDVVAAASGNSSLSSSGAVTTTNANDLIIGANVVYTTTTGAGRGVHQSRHHGPGQRHRRRSYRERHGQLHRDGPAEPARTLDHAARGIQSAPLDRPRGALQRLRPAQTVGRARRLPLITPQV